MGPVATQIARSVSRVSVSGAEYVPRHGPALLVVNHTTIADVPVVLAVLYRLGLHPASDRSPGHSPKCVGHAHVRFLAVERMFRDPFFGRYVRRADFIPVHLRDPRGVQAYAAAEAALRNGEIIGIYPEGDVTSPEDGAPRRLRTGAARMALATHVPIVPIAHHDARLIGDGTIAQTLRRTASALWRRPRVHVVIGKPIEPAAYAGMSALDLTSMIRTRLTETWEAARDARARDA
jgi:1-acyl-sn-glycerol-3-phosphate acyltransferase